MFNIDKDSGMHLVEIGEGFSVEDVQKATGCQLIVASDLKPMQQA